MKEVWWIDTVSGEVKSGKVIDKTKVIYSADFDGEEFSNESEKEYYTYVVKGDDKKTYALSIDNIYLEKPKQ